MSTYSLKGYARMLADSVRREAYEAALAEAVRPGCTVTEIGTGLGYFAVRACEMGAGVVHAIEPDAVVGIARDVARASRFGNRIQFHSQSSLEVDGLPTANVLLSDLRGVLPLFGHHIPSIMDARHRLLAPAGVQVPLRDRILVAPVEAEDRYRECVRPWGDPGLSGVLGPVSTRLVNAWSKVRVEGDQLCAPPSIWAELDYRTITEPNLVGSLSWSLDRPRTLHGFVAWFETDLTESVGFSAGPGSPATIYGHAFFPFPEPLQCEGGDSLDVDLRAHLIGADYIWQWRTRCGDRRFDQSTLAGVPLSAAHIRRGSDSHVPELGEDGRIAGFVFSAMDGSATVAEIATRLRGAFPDRFGDDASALGRVSALAREWGV